MPRPPRRRRVFEGLEERVYKPAGVRMRGLERVSLTLDGLEAIRLADLEGLYQEEAANRMGISRATFARVLSEAHRVVAEALVRGKALDIGGGPIARYGDAPQDSEMIGGSIDPEPAGCPGDEPGAGAEGDEDAERSGHEG
jgi:predicted DNA-binding protein (UPF0251 family)